MIINNNYRTVTVLLMNKAITGKEAEVFIQMLDIGFDINFLIEDLGGGKITKIVMERTRR